MCVFEQISGREVFEFRPELVDNDDEEADDTRYTQGTGGDEVRRMPWHFIFSC